MFTFFTAIIRYLFTSAPVWVIGIIGVVFSSALLLGTDIGYKLFEALFDLIIHVMNTLYFNFDVFNPSVYFSALPPEVVNIIAVIKLPQAIGIIVAAIAIRLILQLIPFTRLGS